MQIYVVRNGQREGPFPLEEVQVRLDAGGLRPEDLAWYEGAPDWVPLRQVPGLRLSSSPPFFPGQGPVVQPPGPPLGGAISSTPPTDSYAVVSLVLGILGVIGLPVVLSLPAVIFGHLSLGRIKRSMGTLGGRGLAIAGLVLGYAVLALAAVVIALIVLSAVVAQKHSIHSVRQGEFAPPGGILVETVRLAEGADFSTKKRAFARSIL